MATNLHDESSSLSKPAERAERAIYTYHCLCTQLILATTTTLNALPSRSSDKSHVCTLPGSTSGSHYANMLNTLLDNKPTVLRLEDGFEKRYAEKCERCDLIVGYHLDKSQYEETKTQAGCRDDVVYLLLGSLSSTADMQAGKKMDQEITKIMAKA